MGGLILESIIIKQNNLNSPMLPHARGIHSKYFRGTTLHEMVKMLAISFINKSLHIVCLSRLGAL